MKKIERNYQICIKCVMDTSDSRISFDESGVCDHCNDFEINVKPNWYPNDEGKKRLESKPIDLFSDEGN